ncbi:HNH endonuclease [Microbacterium protaetiae]|uniref:HNH endonuclease n=1 Tax=Microbacterium protaetiae TaxID=2509458 RepID=A0A4P6ECY6_9MICO|nr:HNH endonuclease signature motif containing protein [Microbacterium protaetiae]QAY59954.1 HNH endonuclease [Microbacterium protaetiae]
MTTAPDDLLETLNRLDEQLSDAVHDTLDDDRVRALGDDELLALARVVESLGRRIDALRIAAAGQVDDRSRSELGEQRLCARNGCINAVDLLCRVTGVSAVTARARARYARATTTRATLTGQSLPAPFPAVAAALTSGVIGVDSIAAIIGVLGPITDRCHPAQLAAAETELVTAATGTGPDGAPPCTADDTRLQAKVWELVLDPDGTLPKDQHAARNRGLHFGHENGGLVPVNGNILTEVYEQFRLLYDAHTNPRVHDHTRGEAVAFCENADSADTDSADTDSADAGDDQPRDPRTRAQKMHDVFATILHVAARSAETPTIGGAPPAVIVTINADDLNRDNGVAFINGTNCTVPAFVARHTACNAGTQHMIVTDNGRIIQLGTPNRTFTTQQRRAIIARDGECVIPGCHMPATWCEIHHVTPHAHGGPTHTDNGVPLCWWHHRTIDTSGWEIRIINGIPEIRAPRNLDPTRTWHPTTGSLHRAQNRLRQRLARQREPATPRTG